MGHICPTAFSSNFQKSRPLEGYTNMNSNQHLMHIKDLKKIVICIGIRIFWFLFKFTKIFKSEYEH